MEWAAESPLVTRLRWRASADVIGPAVDDVGLLMLIAMVQAMVALALASLVWTYAIAPLGEARRPYEVTSIRKIALRTWELAVRPRRGGALAFEAALSKPEQLALLNAPVILDRVADKLADSPPAS